MNLAASIALSVFCKSNTAAKLHRKLINVAIRRGATNRTRILLDYRPENQLRTKTYDVEPYSYRDNGRTFFGYDVQGHSIKAFKMKNILVVRQTDKRYKPRWRVELGEKKAA